MAVDAHHYRGGTVVEAYRTFVFFRDGFFQSGLLFAQWVGDLEQIGHVQLIRVVEDKITYVKVFFKFF